MSSLTQKELSTLNTLLGCEELLKAKCQAYQEQSTDEQVKFLAEQARSMHQKHMQHLFQLLTERK
jgi:hypothetical protein